MICAACGERTEVDPCAVCGDPPLLDGRFRLDEVLGQGAHGVTYGATRLADGAEVAVKELPLRRAQSPKVLELFHREARILEQLEHPGVPTFHDDFVVGTGKRRTLLIVQERIPGRSLREELEGHRYSEAEVAAIVGEIAGILVYLHERSPPVIHRDLKPANVLRRDDSGALVLVDFGSVRDVLDDRVGSTVAGTFGFMAPEQYVGEAVPRTDIHALGALAVCLLTRREPHELLDHSRRLAWHDEVRTGPAMTELMDTMLAPEADDRPTAAQVVALVGHVLDAPDEALGLGASEDETALVPAEPPQLLSPRDTSGLGGPAIEFFHELDTRVDADQFPELVQLIERRTGLSGDPNVLGDQLRWRTQGPQGASRQVEITVAATPSGSEIVVRERCGGLAGGLYGGLGGGLGGGVGGGFFWVPLEVLGVGAMAGWIVVWVVGALLLAHLLYHRIVRQRREGLAEVVGALAGRIEGS